MNSERLSRWLAVIANFGVLVGIVLLIFELNQTQEIARAEMRNAVYQGLTDTLSILDRDTADLIARANAGAELTEADIVLLGRWTETMLRYWENADYQFQLGMYDETEYSAHRIMIRQSMMRVFPGAAIPHYCFYRDGYTQSFRAMIDEFVTPAMCAEYPTGN